MLRRRRDDRDRVSGLYLAADLGPGPRDGLMTGLHFRFGWSIRRARTAVELSVLVAGYLLGGTIGLGTVVFALGIGPLVQVDAPRVRPRGPGVEATARRCRGARQHARRVAGRRPLNRPLSAVSADPVRRPATGAEHVQVRDDRDQERRTAAPRRAASVPGSIEPSGSVGSSVARQA